MAKLHEREASFPLELFDRTTQKAANINLKRELQQLLMLIVPDETDVIVPLSRCRRHVELPNQKHHYRFSCFKFLILNSLNVTDNGIQTVPWATIADRVVLVQITRKYAVLVECKDQTSVHYLPI